MGYMEFRLLCWALCRLYSGSETSGGRTTLRNDEVGGHPNSWHLLHRHAMAVDVVLDDMSQSRKDAFRLAAAKLGIKCLDEGSHLHLQPV